MSVSSGPLLTTNGLVFYYDMTNTQKSWQGAPTTNVLTNTNLDTGWSQGYNTSIIIGDTSAGSPPGVESQVVSFIDSDNNGSGYWYSYGNFAPQADSTTYSVSVWARTVGADWVIQPYTADNSEANRVWLTAKTVTGNGVWQRLEWPNAFTTGVGWDSDSLSFQFNSIPAGQRCWLCATQMEPLSYCTPFVNGTRSSSQALLDLTGRNTLTAANMVYSNNIFTFNGGTSCFDLNNNALISGTQDFTIEAVYYTSATDTAGREIIGNYGTGATANTLWFATHGLWINGATPYHAGSPLRNGTYYTAATRLGSATSLYKNGALELTGTNSTSIAVGQNWRIGKDVGGDGEPFLGNIYMVRVYNRALNAGEIYQNYNAVRTRYGI